MKQKYLISKNDDKTRLIIQEHAELDKEIFSMLCEESFEDKTVKYAITKGKDALKQTLRTQNLFPIGIYAEEIAVAVIKMYESGDDQPVELFFNDLELLQKEQEKLPSLDELEDDEIEDLLDDDVPETDLDDDKNDIKNISYPLKISDDDSADIENDD